MLGELPVVIVHMAIDLSDDCFHKLIIITLTKCLVQIHYISYHLRVEGNRMTHAVLQVQVGIMLAVLYGQAIVVKLSGGTVCHVVHFRSSKDVSLVH